MPDREKPVPDAVSSGLDASLAAADSAATLHQAIQQQIADVLANSGLSEEDKQQILVAMQCPCCGAGGLSLSIKLGPPGRTPSF